MNEGRRRAALLGLELGGVLVLAARLARGVPILAEYGVTAGATRA